MNDQGVAEYIWLLRTQPSFERWGIELREIVNGNREGSVSYFGSAPGYVKSLIFNSPDLSSAEYFFDQALRNVVETWHPLANANTDLDLRILQLLGAYTPSEGMAKALALLRSFGSIESRGGSSRARALKPIVMQVLEQYFPVEQPPVGAFAEYVSQLEAHLAYPDYAAYCMARLRSLRKLEIDEPALGAAIEAAPAILSDLLRVLVTGLPENRQDVAIISAIYRHCLRADGKVLGLLSQFDTSVQMLDMQFIKGSAGPFLVSLAKGWKLRIGLGSDLDKYYVKVHLPMTFEGTAKFFDEVRQGITKEEVPALFDLEVAT